MWGAQVGNGSITKQRGNHFDPGKGDSDQAAIFATSVEMVTTPDTYPVWRTRKPVICVVNHISSTKVFRHRYRYLVVTPGAGTHDNYDSKMLTTDHFDGFVDVTEWEDPFSSEDDVEVVVRHLSFCLVLSMQLLSSNLMFIAIISIVTKTIGPLTISHHRY
jgi:hypothetical protein